jgi:NADH dehydrogenase [ubiquinone] 1 alpha subcomplex assembly factor 7
MNDLARMLAQRIRDQGPITVADYMKAAADHYYRRRDPLGARGDFITAPEISQMFGELIGLWCVETWRAMGAPANFILTELGPGRGTLMRDALRAASLVPAFGAAAQLHLVEASATLRAAQAAALADRAPHWHDRADELPAGPMILVANEFLDALPIRQFQRGANGWRERRVGLAEEKFAFVLDAADFPCGAEPPVGAIGETSPEARDLAAWLGRRVAQQGGAALLIDYGYTKSGFGDTLQALRAHRRVDVLSDPGEADLTAHVDFAAIAHAAAAARIHGPVEQGRFLRALGIRARADRLMATASEREAAAIAAGYRRLVDPEGMGALFKVLAIADPALPALAGFAEAP